MGVNIIIKQFILGSIENNNYLLIDEASKEAVLIDCTQEDGDIEKALQEHNAKLKYILLTHGHFDHVLGVNYFREKYNCQVLMHEADKVLLASITKYAQSFGLPATEIQKIDGYVKDGDTIVFGKNKIKVIHTPGHSQGCVCYLLNDDIFTGDTLFYECVGRTDLPGGNFEQIKSSIKEKLFILDDNIKVYPGHGPASTIGHEKVNNQFV